MTEAEWFDDEDKVMDNLVDALKELGRTNERKLRLYACAWGRIMWEGYGHKMHKRVVEIAEDYADGLASFEELDEARSLAEQFGDEWATVGDGSSVRPSNVALWTAAESASIAATSGEFAAFDVLEFLPQVPVPKLPKNESLRLLREIFGNPFRSYVVDPTWLSHNGGAVVTLAQAAYRERILPIGNLDPVRLQKLGKALKKAGCEDHDLLDHLRSDERHVRGCWVVDLILETADGFPRPPKGKKKRKSKTHDALQTVEDILKSASRLTKSEIARLKEGLDKMTQPQPAKKRPKK